jgi:hypothetical protein
VASRLGNTPETSRAIYIHMNEVEDKNILEKLNNFH